MTIGTKLTFLASAFVLVCFAAPAVAQQYPTIVGEWHAEDHPEDCGTPMATKIQPMAYIEDAYVCRFKDVARNGWEVTWNGTCSDGSSEARSKVVALESNGRLFVTFNGHPSWTALRRCTAATGALPSAYEKVPLHYADYPGDSGVAKKFWPDVVAAITEVDGAGPLASRLTVSVAEQNGYTFAMASSVFSCGSGAHGCPLKVFKEGIQVGEFSACQDTRSHAVSVGSGKFFDCDNGERGWSLSPVR